MSLVNLPNALTVLRLILVPVFLLALFAEGGHDTTWRWIAWAIFAIAAITDRFDGHIARKRGQVTDFGKIADPIADKALTGSALIGLSMLGDLAWWVTLVILIREVGVTLLRFAVLRYGVISASPGGKAKTFVQIIAIGLYILPLPEHLLLGPGRRDGAGPAAHRRHRNRLRGPGVGRVRQGEDRPRRPAAGDLSR